MWVLAKCQYSNDNKIGYAVFYDIDKLGCVTLMFGLLMRLKNLFNIYLAK